MKVQVKHTKTAMARTEITSLRCGKRFRIRSKGIPYLSAGHMRPIAAVKCPTHTSNIWQRFPGRSPGLPFFLFWFFDDFLQFAADYPAIPAYSPFALPAALTDSIPEHRTLAEMMPCFNYTTLVRCSHTEPKNQGFHEMNQNPGRNGRQNALELQPAWAALKRLVRRAFAYLSLFHQVAYGSPT